MSDIFDSVNDPIDITNEGRQEQIDRLNRKLIHKKDKKSGWSGILWAVFLALFIRSCAIEPYNIPSSSLVPTLLVGDYLFITKFDYGYSRHSFPLSIPIIPKGRIFYNTPQRGDIVVFKKPPENKTDYIKRLIGLPGDTVQMRNGRLYINNKIIEREKVGAEMWTTEAGLQQYTRYTETLPNGVKHDIYELGDNFQYDTTEAITIPEGYFLMMGDNRDNSSDSRAFGLVPAENLEGKARMIFYSTTGNGWFFQFWRWPEFLRMERIFKTII